VEFLRFGSSIPGSYWGCCACCIIQNFTVEPDGPASIELVEGDGGTPLGRFAGKTYHEVFRQRLRYGTFSAKDMPNHAFIAILSQTQLGSAIGKKWLAILKAEGFEFLRTVNNSVWNVKNYIFILVRNVGPNAVVDQFTPPKEWTDLPSVVSEPWQIFDNAYNGSLEGAAFEDGPTRRKVFTKTLAGQQKPLYDALPKGVFYTEAELVAAGVPVTYAGKRSHQWGSFAVGYPQQTADQRKQFEAAFEALTGKEKKETPSLRASTPPAVGVAG
jgi:hypothetical protein